MDNAKIYHKDGLTPMNKGFIIDLPFYGNEEPQIICVGEYDDDDLDYAILMLVALLEESE